MKNAHNDSGIAERIARIRARDKYEDTKASFSKVDAREARYRLAGQDIFDVNYMTPSRTCSNFNLQQALGLSTH